MKASIQKLEEEKKDLLNGKLSLSQKFDFDLNDLNLQFVEAQKATEKEKCLKLTLQTKLRSIKDENNILLMEKNEKKMNEVNCKQAQGELNFLQNKFESIVEEKLVFTEILSL